MSSISSRYTYEIETPEEIERMTGYARGTYAVYVFWRETPASFASFEIHGYYKTLEEAQAAIERARKSDQERENDYRAWLTRMEMNGK